jgi:hypothetical protein
MLEPIVLRLLLNHFGDEVYETGCSVDGSHCQGRAPQRSMVYLHSLRRDGDPYSCRKTGRLGSSIMGNGTSNILEPFIAYGSRSAAENWIP